MTNEFRQSGVGEDQVTILPPPADPRVTPAEVPPRPAARRPFVVQVARLVLGAHAAWWGFGALSELLVLLVVDPAPAPDTVHNAAARSALVVAVFTLVAAAAGIFAVLLGPGMRRAYALSVAFNAAVVPVYVAQFVAVLGDPEPGGFTGGSAALIGPGMAALAVVGLLALTSPAARRSCRRVG